LSATTSNNFHPLVKLVQQNSSFSFVVCKVLTISMLLLVSSTVLAQTKTVEGRVTDANDNSALPGVNVLVEGTSKGVATDIDGRYRLELLPEENTIVFSFIGYQTVTETVGERTIIDVRLASDVTSLDEVVVIGYGVVRKSDLTGAVSSVSAEDVVKIPALNPAQALMGKVAGVQVTNTSGAPGASPVVRIRGVGTFNNSSPIYVVDGVILDDISFLNSGDIQSMEVLKDASATAIYGSRGANGVIIITTKLGKKGTESSSINFSAEYSVQQQQKRIDLLEGSEFASVVNDIAPGSYNNINAVPSTDWQELIFRNAPIHNYQISATGSSAKSQYYFGLGYFRQEGIIPKSVYERLTIKANNVYHLSPSFRVGNNLTLAPTKQQNTNSGVVFAAYRAQPTIDPYLPNGSYSPVPGVGNVLADIEYTNSFSDGIRGVGNVYAEVDFLKNFTFRSSVGVDAQYYKNRNFTPLFFVSPQQQTSYSTLTKDWNDRLSWLWENTISYNADVGLHGISAVAGYTMQDIRSENLGLQGRNITRDVDDFWYINPNNIYGQQVNNAVDADNNYSMMSVLGRVNYTFAERYLFTATFRLDGSSKFSSANRYATFPSFAVGWNAINESFMQEQEIFSNLKLRASWGIIGNEKINYLQQYSVVANGINSIFGTAEAIVPGLTYAGAGNPNLTWENTYQTDIGVELGFFDNRLTSEIDYFSRDTKDILIALPVPGYLGNGDGATITYNAAEVLNRGIELTVKWETQINDDLRYQIGGMLTTIKNETLKVSGSGGSDDYLLGRFGGQIVTRTEEGLPIGSFFGYQVDGIFQNQSELDAYPHRADAGVGDLRFVDTNGDGLLNDDDRVNMGSPIPTALYGINLEVGYKAFDASIDFNGQSGNTIFNGKETIRPDLYNFERHVINRWRGEGTSTVEPRATSGGYNWLPSTRFIQDGSYFRLRSVTLGYNLPQSLAGKLKMRTARVYLRGTNVFTWSKFTGYTPEIASYSVDGRSTSPLLTGIDAGSYPVPAIYSAGLNVTF
jgi:TonB-linked SusC/RagA family outer membrane protein